MKRREEVYIQFSVLPSGPFQTVALHPASASEANSVGELKEGLFVSYPDSEGYVWMLLEKQADNGRRADMKQGLLDLARDEFRADGNGRDHLPPIAGGAL